MIELTQICMGVFYVHKLTNDQNSTWMSQVSGLRKELLPSLPKAQSNQSLGESAAPCLLVSWSELAPLRPEDFELILLGHNFMDAADSAVILFKLDVQWNCTEKCCSGNFPT